MDGSAQGNDILAILSQDNVISSEMVKKVRLESSSTGKALKDIILGHNLASQEQLAQAEAKFFNVPFIPLSDAAVSPEALGKISRQVSERYTIITLEYNSKTNELSVAMANPIDLEAIEFLERKSGARIKPLMSTRDQIEKAIATRYTQDLSSEVKSALRETDRTPQKIEPMDALKMGQIVRESSIAKIVSTVLEFAMKGRASDIHIEPEETKTRVRYRIDGILHEKLVIPRQLHNALVSRIKILSGMKIDEKRIPQDGRFDFKADSQEVDLRVSSLPSVFGEKIVMRLLKKSGGVPDLPELGLRGLALKHIQTEIQKPYGIIIVCGPTGSGKTTTLYSAITRINTSKVNIMTLEDPVEYQIVGVNQVQANPSAGLTFATGLRSFLRQDPDIIMVGEIRDAETTELAVQASLTGHLVFSTLHTNDAAGAVPRLLDLGAEPFLLASSLSCVIAQRVMRRICPDCKQEYEATPEVIEELKGVLGKLFPTDKKNTLFKGGKCAKCNNTGYLGRIGIFEVMPVSEKLGRLTMERSSSVDIQKQAISEGMITLRQDGYLKVLEGLSTMEEVLRVAQE
ncbi:GspE/PulE family protein [Patescibacteria group bacterium]|nr:GspE/PulE family protein [Patescibacteria group bacterium]